MTQQERNHCIESIRRLPERVRAAVEGLHDNQLDTPYREGGWTMRQVVHHLADSHANAYARFRLVLTEEHPTIKPYDQDAWATLKDAATLPLQPSLQILEGLHYRWAYMLDDVLASKPESVWQRTGFHLDNGTMTLDDLLRTYSTHGDTHCEQLLGLRKRMGW